MTGDYRINRIKSQYLWLEKLRWFAILGVFLSLATTKLISLDLPYFELFILGGMLIVHNIAFRFLLNFEESKPEYKKLKRLKNLVLSQIIIDLLLLTLLIHYSGGIENPFMFFYPFHIVISSILFSHKTSRRIALFSILLLTSLALVEYFKFIPHYSIYPRFRYYNDILCMVAILIIFAISAIIIVYLTGTIASRLYEQENTNIETNRELSNVNNELKRKDKIKNEYVLRVTHDIKGHLAAIQTNLAVLAKGYAGKIDEKQSQYVQAAYNRTLNLTEFVMDLLKLTQMRLSNNLDIKNFSVSQTVLKVCNSLNGIAKEKQLDFEWKVDEDMFIKGDQFSIEEAISNLVLNAVKYTSFQGKINVIAYKNNNNIIIEIKDTGQGIPDDEISKIFNEFYRASNVKTIAEGTGLGLSLVKQIIDRHNGEIKVSSILEKGTTFSIYLPLSK
jgi:signal transduction histidine kinase